MRRPATSTLLLVGLALLLFRASLFFGEVFYKRDIHLVWHAQVETMVRAVAAGAWPIWDPNPAFGQPLLANPDAQIAYPPTWLNLIVRPWLYYTLYAVSHFLLGAFGMRSLARHLGLSELASTTSAALWALSGPFLSMVDLWHHYAGAAWMPLVVLAADRAFAGKRRELVVFALVLAAQILASSADMCALTLLLVAAFGATRHLDRRKPLGSANRRVVATGLFALLLAGGLAAPLWLTALEVVAGSARAQLPEGVRTYWSLHPLVALETVVPGLWSQLPLSENTRRLFFESREPFLSSLYLGAATFGLVTVGAAASRHGQRRVLLWVFVLALLLALGSHTPVYAFLTTVLPPLRLLRYPVKYMVVAAFAWSLLAGMGMDACRDEKRRRVAVGLALSAGAIVLLVVLIGLIARFLPAPVADKVLALPPGIPLSLVVDRVSLRLLITSLVGGLALVLALTLLSGRLAPDRFRLAAATLALLDLAAYHRAPNPTAPRDLYTYRPEVLAALGGTGPHRVYVYDYSFPGKVQEHLAARGPYALARYPDGWDQGAATALGMQMYLAPESAGRFDLSQAFSIDLRGLHSAPMPLLESLLRRVEGTPAHLRLLQAGGTTHALSFHPIPDLEEARVLPGLFERPILLQRVPSPLPRTFAVAGARRVTDEEAIRALLDPGFDLRGLVLLSDGDDVPARAGFEGHVRILEARADRVVLDAHLNAPGFVVLLETYDRGWKARIDGRPTRLHRANAVFRAVGAGPGRHRIELTYRPRGLTVGLGLCALSALLVVVMAALPPFRPAAPSLEGPTP